MRVLTSNVSRGLTLAILAAVGLAVDAWAQPESRPAQVQPKEQPATPPPEAPKAEKPVEPPKVVPETPAPKADPFVLGHKAEDIDGRTRDLAEFKGKVILIVNTASKCGYTGQYRGLEALYQEFGKDGFTVLAFPSGDFKNQEFGDNADIKAFCTGPESDYKVTFPLFGKVSVTGEKAHPLFKQLAAQPAPVGGEPKWNFTKWLVDREGKVVTRFEFRVKPDDSELRKGITDLLKKK